MLALLALALFPVLAHAGTPAETTYTPVVPGVETKESKESNSKAHKENPLNQGTTSNNEKAEGSAVKANGTEKPVEPEEEEGSGKGQGAAGGGNGGNSGGNHPSTGGGGEGGGNPAKSGGGSQSGDGISNQQAVAHTQPGANVSESSGGSSPVVPILIAVVVLAAISIGIVLYRQRKSGPGPDSRVSSPNAS
jgi:cobalamin biosynthesis Mg chelatase CobN